METRLRECRLIDTQVHSTYVPLTAQLHNARPIGTYETARPHASERGVQGGTHLSHFVFGFRAKQRLREAVWKTEGTTHVKFCVSPSCTMRIGHGERHMWDDVYDVCTGGQRGGEDKTIERLCDLTNEEDELANDQ